MFSVFVVEGDLNGSSFEWHFLMTRMLNDKVYEERKGYIFIDNVVFVIVYIIPVTL